MSVEFFGVRHHSPAAARLLRERIASDPPGLVLIEGPSDYNDQLDQLALNHELPIMIYSWAPVVPDAEPGSPDWAARRAAFYPLTEFSPEWAAVRAAQGSGVEFRFIDLPWLALVGLAKAENRFADDSHVTNALERLLAEVGVDTLDALSDELVEIDSELSLADFRTRMHTLGAVLRGEPDEETTLRERYMAARIREASAETDGVVLVVCGAAHVAGLAELLDGAEEVPHWRAPAADERYGIALTPTSYAALDALTGYNAGQPNPGFYDALHADRLAGRTDTAERLFGDLMASLRDAGQFVSPADLIAVLSSARALAALRGHQQLWRTDLLDGVVGALVKDDSGENHPLVQRIHEVLRGTKIGVLAKEARRPPLVGELAAEISALGLAPTTTARVELADLTSDEGLRRSQLLHSLTELEVPLGTLLRSADEDGVERWRIAWSPAFEGELVAAARFGATRADAVTTVLLGHSTQGEPRAAASIMLRAALCGVGELAESLQRSTADVLATTGDLAGLGEAMALLLRLYRYDPLLRTTGRTDIGALITTAYDRAARLLERVGPQSDGPGTDSLVAAIRVVSDAGERTAADLPLSVAAWDASLASVVEDANQAAGLRGAALGARWLSGHVPDAELASAVHLIQPESRLGDFVYGLLAVAREAALRRPEFIQTLDGVVSDMPWERFLDAVPGMRRAFSAYPPRERSQVAAVLLGESGAAALQGFTGSGGDALAIASFEHDVVAAIERFFGSGVL